MAIKLLTIKGIDSAISKVLKEKKSKSISDGEGLSLMIKFQLKTIKKNHGDTKEIEVAPAYWRFRSTLGEKRILISIGKYPAVTMLDARDMAEKLREKIAQGIDPRIKKESSVGEGKAEEPDARMTFEELSKCWFDKSQADNKLKTKKRNWAILELHVFPLIGGRFVDEITALDCIKVIEAVEKKEEGLVEVPRRVGQFLKKVFSHGVRLQQVPQNPAAGIEEFVTSRRRGHLPSITTPKEFGVLLRKIDRWDRQLFSVPRYLRLMPLVFVRPSELREMQWSQIDFEAREWYCPQPKTHNEQPEPLRVPLSNQAIEILEDQKRAQKRAGVKSRYVFNGFAKNSHRPLSEGTIADALRSVGVDTKSEFTTHGFRAAAKTMLTDYFNYKDNAIELQLGHSVKDSNGRAYNRAKMMGERKKIMQAWADFVDAVREDRVGNDDYDWGFRWEQSRLDAA